MQQCLHYHYINISLTTKLMIRGLAFPLLKLSFERLYYHLIVVFIDSKNTRFCRNPYLEALPRTCSVKKVLLKVLQNSHENIRPRVPFLIKLKAEVCNFIKKEILALVFSCEFCQISKNNFLARAPLVPVFSK